MQSKIVFAGLATILFFSCSNNTQPESKPAVVTQKDSMVVKDKKKFEDIVFDSKKDLVCGMPLRAGIEDTAHYMGKVYGFCATECKDEFKKDPQHYLTAK